MAPVIWGLNLAEMQWSKFGSSYMFGNTDYHLRRTKFIVYQLAMIFCVVSESLGTAALADFVQNQQGFIDNGRRAGKFPDSTEYNDDYVGAASYNIWAGVFVAFIFGAAFFFDLFWPERREDRGIRLAWKWCAVAASVFMTSSAITLTVITATRRAYIISPMAAELERMVYDRKAYNLVYIKNARCIAAIAFVWPGWIAVIASTAIMWMSVDYVDKYGPYSRHKRMELNGGKADEGVIPSHWDTNSYIGSGSMHQAPAGADTSLELEKPTRPSNGERTYTGA